MRTHLLCGLILCLGGAAGACSQATGSDQSQQADRNDSQASHAPTVELALTGLT